MPLVRMTNLHLEPGEGSFDDLLAMSTTASSCARTRAGRSTTSGLNFQFGTQIAWEIKNGKLGRMLRDATYMGTTPIFWAGARRRRRRPTNGSSTDDELRQVAQPGQHAHVSHGTSAVGSATSRLASRDV
jgi:TldD protein